MDDFRLVGCVACFMLGHPETPSDVQHFLSGNIRIGHLATCPLCPAHHRGVNYVELIHLASFGVSPGKFREVFGSDQFLRDLTQRLVTVQRAMRGLPPREAKTEAERVG